MSKLSPSSVRWMNSGQGLACGLESGRAAVWTASGARLVKGAGRGPVYVVAFSPDDASLVCGSESPTAKLIPLQGKGAVSFKGDSGIVSHASFDSSGQHLLCGRALWTRDGNAVLRKHFSMLSTFLPDDRIVSAGPEYTEDRSPRMCRRTSARAWLFLRREPDWPRRRAAKS